MSNRNQPGQAPRKTGRRQFRISVRAVKRDTPDVHKLARAAIELAMAQAEADPEQHESNKSSDATKNREVADD